MASKLTEPRRYTLLREIASLPVNETFAPYRGTKTLCLRMLREGLLQVAGLSVMYGDLYVITSAGRAALSQHEAKEE